MHNRRLCTLLDNYGSPRIDCESTLSVHHLPIAMDGFTKCAYGAIYYRYFPHRFVSVRVTPSLVGQMGQ